MTEVDTLSELYLYTTLDQQLIIRLVKYKQQFSKFYIQLKQSYGYEQHSMKILLHIDLSSNITKFLQYNLQYATANNAITTAYTEGN